MAQFTFDHKASEELETRLRKIVLYSADVLPDRVTDYLHTTSNDDRWQAKEQILKTFPPLVDYVPTAFVDFALRELISTPDDKEAYSFHEMSKCGIEGNRDYHPPAPSQGPFLRLLRTHEDEGLRLVNGLTNAATACWCRREQNEHFLGYRRTPLPVVIHLPSGSKEYWGNEDVYCWYRHTSLGPYAVISALMALEVWMEEQIQQRRDALELINKVLAGSESVAVLGVCAALALLFPSEPCLRAVLPLVRNPLVWIMDIHRRHKDMQGGSPTIDFFGEHKVINQQLKESNARPHRRRELMQLVPIYLFAGSPDLQQEFQQALADFGAEAVCQYEEEEKADTAAMQAKRDRLDSFKTLLDKDNYRQIEVEGTAGWQFQPPQEHMEKQDEQQAEAQGFLTWIALDQWAQTTLEATQVPDEAALEQAVRTAQSLQREGDFQEVLGPPDADSTRQQAVVAVASAIAGKALPWAQQHGHLSWCRSVLMAAARSPRRPDEAWNRETVFHLDHKLAAARGLTALIAQGMGDNEIRRQLVELAADSQLQVVRAVFTGLRTVWQSEEVLCWNCLNLALSVAQVPRDMLVPGGGLVFNDKGTAWMNDIIGRHAANVERREWPQPFTFSVDERSYFLWDLATRCLLGIPVEHLTQRPESKARILQISDALLDWTVSENLQKTDERKPRHHEAPYEWNDFFMGWLANLARCLDTKQAERHILAPIKGTWPRIPDLMADLLNGCLQYQIGFLEPLHPNAVQTWEQLCQVVLDSPELVAHQGEDYLPRDLSEAVTLIVFVNYGRYLFNKEWPHAGTFTGVIDRWVEVIGTNHEAYRAMLTMLQAAGAHFLPAQAVGWILKVVSRSKDVPALWQSRDNGERTAKLLYSLWRRSQQAIQSDSAIFSQFSSLLDRLAANGVTLASVMQQQLDRPTAT